MTKRLTKKEWDRLIDADQRERKVADDSDYDLVAEEDRRRTYTDIDDEFAAEDCEKYGQCADDDWS